MAETRPEPVRSEERTEPFTESQYESLLEAHEDEGIGADTDGEGIPLDALVVEDHHHEQGVRLLFRPFPQMPDAKIGDNFQTLLLRAEVASSEHKVLAVTQTSQDIKFTVNAPLSPGGKNGTPQTLWFEFYYDPASDRVIFLNMSRNPIQLERLSQPLDSPSTLPKENLTVNPQTPRALRPGTWRIKVEGVPVSDFRILEKRHLVSRRFQDTSFAEDSSSSTTTTTTTTTTDDVSVGAKRSFSEDGLAKKSKRRISEVTEGNPGKRIMFLDPSPDPLVFSLSNPSGNSHARQDLTTTRVNPLLDTEEGQMVHVSGMYEVDQYRLTRQRPVANTGASAVYTAQHSHHSDKVVIVKILKTKAMSPVDRPGLHERQIISQANSWKREVQAHRDLKHKSIVRYLGGDARFLSFYMEHVDAHDLGKAGTWRDPQTWEFRGTRAHAGQVLRDISDALEYLHVLNWAHNDIKPGNILYKPEQGAYLCDFGLSSRVNELAKGGTPFYIPPEFIGAQKRGPPADVWALGVVMLYLLKKLPMPEGFARPDPTRPQLYWQIAGVNQPSRARPTDGNGKPPAMQMREWLTMVADARQRLDVTDRLESIVRQMLSANPDNRITMSAILQALED